MLLTILLFVGLAHADDPSVRQLHAEYLRSCGGKIYSKCDDEVRSQDRLYAAARARAVETDRRVLVVAGADWCPPCVAFARKFERDVAFREQLERRNVVVELNAELTSTRKVLVLFGLNVPSYPTFLVHDPRTGEARRLEGIGDGEDSTAILAGEREPNPPTVFKEPEGQVGGIRIAALDSAFARRQARFGSSDLEISTRTTGEAKARLIADGRHAFDLFQGFDYVNAARAAREGLRLEADNPVLLALFTLSVQQFADGESPFLQRALQDTIAAAAAYPLDADDRKFVRLAQTAVCVGRADACGDQSLVAEGPLVRVRGLLPFTKADYQAYALLVLKDWEGLERLARENPGHSAAHHYLTHGYESQARPELAALEAQLYLEAAPDLPHAHHMYGHILPQLGRWDEALDQFRRAHALHLAEFEKEGLRSSEDWHYAHNAQLLSATLVHLKRVPEALALFTQKDDARLRVDLLAADGRFEEALRLQDENRFADFRKSESKRVLLLLGQRRIEEAQKAMDELIRRGELDDPETLYARVAMRAVRTGSTARRGAKPEAANRRLLAQLAIALQKPGFDAWSSTAVERAILARVLRANDRDAIADRVNALPGFRAGADLCLGR